MGETSATFSPLASNIGDHGLGHLATTNQVRDLLLLAGANLAEHDNGPGLWIGLEHTHNLRQRQADHGVAADMDHCRRADALSGQIVSYRRGNAAGARADTN